MATYKLIQDIEAEDHILGPLTLRQFIYALVAAFLYYLSFFVVSKGVAFLLIIFIPPALFFTFFAFPFGKDQSTEVWALAKLRYFLKPRRRVWNQSGIKELVTITVPKKIERILTDGLGQEEVKSRLGALANTLDSRGWAVKNVDANKYTFNNPLVATASSDRLVDIGVMPREVPNEVYTTNDVLDVNSSPVAQQFESMITESERKHRQDVINKMNNVALAERLKPTAPTQAQAPAQPQQPVDYWFMNQPSSSEIPTDHTMFANSKPMQPGQSIDVAGVKVTPEEQAIIDKAKAAKSSKQSYASHLKTLQPLGSEPAPVEQPVAPVTPTPPQPAPTPANPAIMALANNKDLNIATIARQAKKETEQDNDEVVISLH